LQVWNLVDVSPTAPAFLRQRFSHSILGLPFSLALLQEMRRFHLFHSSEFREQEGDCLTRSYALFLAVERLSFAQRRMQGSEMLSPERQEQTLSGEPEFISGAQQHRKSLSV
jgi:hypothetical protein